VKSIVLALLMLLPSLAAACPNCIGSQDNSSTILKVVGAFMLVPFVVFYVVLRIIRRAERDLVE
jgi:hypothetical protein